MSREEVKKVQEVREKEVQGGKEGTGGKEYFCLTLTNFLITIDLITPTIY